MEKNIGISPEKFDLKLIEFDDNERVICEIRKHPIGLWIIVVVGFFVSAAVFFSTMLLSVWVGNNAAETANTIGSSQDYSTAVLVLGIFLTSFSVIGVLISVYLYQSNVILITTEKIAQIIYRSIFSRKISQLSIGDVQDVTIDQHGIIAHLFNYGTIVIETAGEQQNYTFTMVPDPYMNAKYIVSSQEENMKKHGN